LFEGKLLCFALTKDGFSGGESTRDSGAQL
jgi:hypothetical protein